MGYWKGRLRSWLTYAGKGDQKVACVFGVDAESSHRAVLHLRAGAPGVPIWLFTTAATHPETVVLCERVYTNTNGLALVVGAQWHLWERWVAITAGTWVVSGTSH